MSQREVKAATCDGKKRYLTYTAAQRPMKRTLGKKYRGAYPYRCRFCQGWHVGRDNRS